MAPKRSGQDHGTEMTQSCKATQLCVFSVQFIPADGLPLSYTESAKQRQDNFGRLWQDKAYVGASIGPEYYVIMSSVIRRKSLTPSVRTKQQEQKICLFNLSFLKIYPPGRFDRTDILKAEVFEKDCSFSDSKLDA